MREVIFGGVYPCSALHLLQVKIVSAQKKKKRWSLAQASEN